MILECHEVCHTMCMVNTGKTAYNIIVKKLKIYLEQFEPLKKIRLVYGCFNDHISSIWTRYIYFYGK